MLKEECWPAAMVFVQNASVLDARLQYFKGMNAEKAGPGDYTCTCQKAESDLW